MGAAKRFYGQAAKAPEALRYVQPDGRPLVADPDARITPSKAPGWVQIRDSGPTRFARAEPATATAKAPAKATQQTLF